MPENRVPTALWRARPEVIVALDERFGEPLDTYVNGSQVWLRDDGPAGQVIEWRLHPVPSYRRPAGVATEEVFSAIALALATGGDLPSPLTALWEGLEAFPAYGEEVEPQPLAAAAGAALGIEPDAAGLVAHELIADEWERSGGATSIVEGLLRQLGR